MTIPDPKPNDSFIRPRDRLTDRQHAAIGRVAAAWSVLEYLMESVLAKLALAPSFLGHALTDNLGPDNRISAIKGLVGVHRIKYKGQLVADNVLEAIDRVIRAIERLKGDRNHIVHGVWGRMNEQYMHRIDLKTHVRSGAVSLTSESDDVAEIEAVSVTIQAAADRLSQLSRLIPEPSAALLDKLQKQEQLNRRKPDAQLVRLSQRRSYTRLLPDSGPAQAPQKKNKPAMRAAGKK